MGKANILLVEDDKEVSKLILQILSSEGYEVKTIETILQAQGSVEKMRPDLVVLDRKLPDADGIEFCKSLKSNDNTKDIPILFLSAKKAPADRILGLKLGGDDYLTKPFVPDELVARVEALLRRSHTPEPDAHQLRCEDLWMDLDKRQAYIKDKPLELWPKELDLLQVFLEKKNRVLTREYLLQRVWGYDQEIEITVKTVDVTVGRLRKKLSHYQDKIVAIKNYGYRFDDDAK